MFDFFSLLFLSFNSEYLLRFFFIVLYACTRKLSFLFIIAHSRKNYKDLWLQYIYCKWRFFLNFPLYWVVMYKNNWNLLSSWFYLEISAIKVLNDKNEFSHKSWWHFEILERFISNIKCLKNVCKWRDITVDKRIETNCEIYVFLFK